MEATLTYTNPRGQSVLFKTRRMADMSHPKYVCQYITGVGGPLVEYEANPLTGGDGSQLGASRMASRIVQTGCMVYGATDAERDKHLQALVGILNPALGEGTLTYRNHCGVYTATARCSLLPSFHANSKQDKWKPVLIDYECAYPYWKGQGAWSEVVATSARGFKLPFRMPFFLGKLKFRALLSNASAVDVPLRLVIYGPSVNPVVTNATTGESLRVRKSIAAGEVLTLVTGPEIQSSIRTVDGVVTDAMNYVNLLRNKWIALKPGINELRYTSDDASQNTRIEVYWNDWYLGVG